MCRHFEGRQIGGNVHECLVDGIDMNVFRSHIFQVYLIYARAVLYVEHHARRCYDIIYRPFRMCFEFCVRHRSSGCCLPACRSSTLCIDFPYPLYDLEQPCTSRYAVCFHRRTDSQTNRLLRPAFVSHDKVRGERVKSPFHAFHRSIERLQVYGDVCPSVFYHHSLCLQLERCTKLATDRVDSRFC